MITKTMDWEEYIKKSDVLQIISDNYPSFANWDNCIIPINNLPTINLSVIDDFYEKNKEAENSEMVLELKQRLLSTNL